mmetsp:Transcript_30137/g.81611  ORF Transcript_30137/g.81611 Transcript_30137/m.81611 type:complete len:347 (+) Transcript_30137:13-1053(+)
MRPCGHAAVQPRGHAIRLQQERRPSGQWRFAFAGRPAGLALEDCFRRRRSFSLAPEPEEEEGERRRSRSPALRGFLPPCSWSFSLSFLSALAPACRFSSLPCCLSFFPLSSSAFAAAFSSGAFLASPAAFFFFFGFSSSEAMLATTAAAAAARAFASAGLSGGGFCSASGLGSASASPGPGLLASASSPALSLPTSVCSAATSGAGAGPSAGSAAACSNGGLRGPIMSSSSSKSGAASVGSTASANSGSGSSSSKSTKSFGFLGTVATSVFFQSGRSVPSPNFLISLKGTSFHTRRSDSKRILTICLRLSIAATLTECASPLLLEMYTSVEPTSTQSGRMIGRDGR